MVDGQFQELQEPGLSRPGWNHKEKLCVRLMQLSQNVGEELMRWKCVRPQVLPWEREGIHRQGQRVQHWRHKG